MARPFQTHRLPRDPGTETELMDSAIHNETHFDLRDLVCRFLAQRQVEAGLPASFDPDMAVFENGLIDSMALIELITAVEQAGGQRVDMLRFDPSAVETARDLIKELQSSL